MNDPPCQQCTAVCCKQTSGHDYAVMLEDHEVGYETITVDDDLMGIVNCVPYVSGKCFYLNRNDRCGIYERRPLACREFNCISGYQKDRISFFLEDHPEVIELIELNWKR